MVLQCNNGVGSNPVEGRTKIWQLLFCTSYNLYKIFIQVITCITPSYIQVITCPIIAMQVITCTIVIENTS